jgi:DNA-binding CsgD family transcriptional regulator
MPRVESPVIGRGIELTRIDTALDDVTSGRGSVLLVTGPAGIGKTRLVEYLVTRSAARSVTTTRGNCVPDEGAPALWPWWQALADRPELADRLELDGGAEMTAARRLRVFDQVLRELSGPARVVVLEDLHWADESTLTLLRLAVGRPGLLVMATYRDDEQSSALRACVAQLRRDPATALLALAPWSVAEVADFVAGRADASWIPLLHRISGGVPLFVGELLAALVAAGMGDAAAPVSGDWPLGVPEQLRGIVEARLAGLAPEALAVVGASAVVGVDSTVDEIALLAGGSVESVSAWVESAHGLLVHVNGRISFGHILVRESVYDYVSISDRTRWHRTLADAIDACVVPGESVTHRLRSITDAASRSAAVLACRDGAAKALSHLAYDRAAELYDAALGVLGHDDGARVDLLLDAAEMWYQAGRVERAVARCQAAAALDPPSDRLVRAALTVRGINGSVSQSIVLLCDRALAKLSEHDEAGRARVLAQRALALADVVHQDLAEAPSREALDIAERTGDPLAMADALRARQQVLSGPWYVVERLELARRMLALGQAAPPDGELWARLWRIDAALQLGTISVLDDELALLKLYADRLGWANAHWHFHRMSAVRATLLGAFDLAEQHADKALAVTDQLSDDTVVHLDLAFRMELYRLQGRGGELHEAAVDLASVPMPLVAVVSGQVGRFLLAIGDIDGALAMFERLRPQLPTLPREGRWLPTVTAAAVLAAHFGDLDVAEHCYTELLPMARYYLAAGSGTVVCLGSVSRPLGTVAAALGRRDDAIGHFEDAIAMDDRIGALPFRARAEVALAEVLADGPSLSRAGKLARSAAVTARRLRMTPTVARADAVLDRVRRAQHDAVPLTAREREVLTLLSIGAPNRTIAERLVLSERTVETHVSNVLGKLGVANRAQAAAWAVENGYGTT